MVDVGSTGNIFVGDSSSNLYALTPAGATAAPALALGVNGATNQGMINGGIRDGAIIDTTNGVGYVVNACNPNTSAASGETDTGTAGNTGLVQFKFTSNTLTSVTVTGLDSGANQSCTTAGFPVYAPTLDNRYFTLGIGSATEASNGEIIGAASGTGGQQLKPFSFVSSVLQPAPLGKPQMGTNASVISPLTEFFNGQAFTITQVTATATTVTVTANNNLAANDPVTISGVTANSANNCTAADVTAINGTQTVASATATSFTFSATIPTATSGSGCALTNASVGVDYLFVGVNANPTEVYAFALPNPLEIAQGVAPTAAATNTADVAGGTSGIIVDNDSIDGQASSVYFGTLATSTTICGSTAAFCAVKLTQAALQ